jgi:hypothetical protein
MIYLSYRWLKGKMGTKMSSQPAQLKTKFLSLTLPFVKRYGAISAPMASTGKRRKRGFEEKGKQILSSLKLG